MQIIFDHNVERRLQSCELLFGYETIVPLRLKVCKSCEHVFRAKREAEHNLPDKAMKHMRVLQYLVIYKHPMGEWVNILGQSNNNN